MRSGTGGGTLMEVRDGLEDPQGGPGRIWGLWVGPGRVWEPSGRSGWSRGTLGEVRDGSEDLWRGAGRVGGTSGWFGTGHGNLEEVRE